MKNLFRSKKLSRPLSILVAIAFLVAIITPLISGGFVHAYGQVQSRSITMSDSNAGDGSVSYLVSFNTQTTGFVKGIVVDFCSNDPIISDSCTAPTGFTVGASPSFTPGTNTTASWTAASSNSGRTYSMTYSSAPSLASGATISFTITNVTNPTAQNTTFYARIFTFATTSDVTTWLTTTDGSSTTAVVDAGGIALSTAQAITVTSKVQEQITFCVFTNAATSCSGAAGSSVALGDNHGVLSSSGPYVDINTQYILGTNASHGASIDIKGATLNSGSSTIPAINSGSSTPILPTANVSQFGICSYGNVALTIAATYNGTTNGGGGCNTTSQTAGGATTGGIGTATFGFNSSAIGSTYGDQLATMSAGAPVTGTVAFVGNINVTQAAGIYTSVITFIATGTY